MRDEEVGGKAEQPNLTPPTDAEPDAAHRRLVPRLRLLQR